MRSSFESKVLLAFTAAILVVGGLAVATWKLARDADEVTHLVAHTQEVLKYLALSRTDALSVELSSQNYRITGDAQHLALRDATIRSREETLDRLWKLTADSPKQQIALGQLREVMNERLAIARNVEKIRGTQGADAANAYVNSANLAQTRARMYALIEGMQNEEEQLLDLRASQQLHVRYSLLVVGTLFSLLLFGLLAATYVVIRQQVREIREAQREVANSREDLFITLQSIGDAVLATDRHGKVTRLNPVAERLTGWTSAEALGRTVDEVFRIIHEQTREPAVIPVAEVIRTGEVRGLANHTAIIARDGTETPIADSASPIRDHLGNIRGAVLVFRDVTLEYQAQKLIRDQNALLAQRVEERTVQLRDSEGHLRSVINNVPALIAYVDADERYVYVNHQYQDCFAPGNSHVIGSTVRDVLGETRYAIAAQRIARALHGEPQNYDWQPFEGVWQSISYIPRHDAGGARAGYYVLGTDITQRKRFEHEIQGLNAALEQRVRALEHVGRGLRALEAGGRAQLHADDERELLKTVCRSVMNAAGYHAVVIWYVSLGEAQTLSMVAACGPADAEGVDQAPLENRQISATGDNALARALHGGRSVMLTAAEPAPGRVPGIPGFPWAESGVASPLQVGGKSIGVLTVLADKADAFSEDEASLLTQVANDLSIGIATLRSRDAQRKTQQELQHLTHYDALTGLPNEALFVERLLESIQHSERLGQSISVLQANIERLSEINLAFGFTCGDQVLKEFGRRLRMAVPATATVARLRGDEFTILLPDSDAHRAHRIAQDLEEALGPSFRYGDISLEVSAHFGIAEYPRHGRTPHDLLRNVDIAVHQARDRGMLLVVFDATQIPDHSSRLQMVGELRSGIRTGELRLYLQPKVELASGRVCGAEGLVRWMHPVTGLVPPGDFIDLAEHAGLIDSITMWVIEAALQQIREMTAQGSIMPLSVNLSVRNLRDRTLVGKVRKLLNQYGIDANLLELEITESAAMEDPELALSVLNDFRREGILLSIDDFGTGYSSLSYLQKLPVDYIKIDQSFVQSMSTSPDAALIVRSTIDLVRDLGRRTVAEGVETQENWTQLARFGCDVAQGYFIARPMPAAEFVGWMRDFRAPALA